MTVMTAIQLGPVMLWAALSSSLAVATAQVTGKPPRRPPVSINHRAEVATGRGRWPCWCRSVSRFVRLSRIGVAAGSPLCGSFARRPTVCGAPFTSLMLPVELWQILQSTLLIVCPHVVDIFRTLFCNNLSEGCVCLDLDRRGLLRCQDLSVLAASGHQLLPCCTAVTSCR